MAPPGTVWCNTLIHQAGVPRAEIEQVGRCVTVRFRPSVYTAPERIGHDLTKRQQTILSLLGRRADMALRALVALLNTPNLRIPDWAVKGDQALLKGLQLIDTYGHGRGACWRLRRQ